MIQELREEKNISVHSTIIIVYYPAKSYSFKLGIVCPFIHFYTSMFLILGSLADSVMPEYILELIYTYFLVIFAGQTGILGEYGIITQ